jgi:hypothetical protein
MSSQEQEKFSKYADLESYADRDMKLCLHIEEPDIPKLVRRNLNRSLFLWFVSIICLLAYIFFVTGS